MILSETIFIDRQPVGIVRMNSNTGQFDFSPREGISLLSKKRWSDIDKLKGYREHGGILEREKCHSDQP